MIKRVVRFPNDVVIVFDENGEQIPEYQGYYSYVKTSILRDAPPDTVFSHLLGTVTGFQDVSRNEW